MDKIYLGDSVYAAAEDFGVTLTTENGLPTDPSNKIYLEGIVVKALISYLKDSMGWRIL